jgi:magnesium-transporting ATPase (P-type)
MPSEDVSNISFDGVEVLEPSDRLLRDLRTTAHGLSASEAARRLVQFGHNELRRRRGVQWPHEIARQLTHPLALLLWVAALLSFAVDNQAVGIAVLLVIVLNALFAFVQELQAERAVEALAAYMPTTRDGPARWRRCGERGARVGPRRCRGARGRRADRG